jgi:hypothetical protein
MHDWWGIALHWSCGIAIIAWVFMSSKDKPPPVVPVTTSPAFNWWQAVPIAISMAALVTSMAAAYIAYDQGQQTRLHHRLSVKPEIQISFYTNEQGAGWELINAGLGPARVKWFKVTFDHEEMPNWVSIIAKLQIQGTYMFTYPTGAILRPGHASKPLWLKDRRAADIVVKNSARLRTEMCYCSLYDQCWRLPQVNPNDKNCAQEIPKVIFQASASELIHSSEVQTQQPQ